MITSRSPYYIEALFIKLYLNILIHNKLLQKLIYKTFGNGT